MYMALNLQYFQIANDNQAYEKIPFIKKDTSSYWSHFDPTRLVNKVTTFPLQFVPIIASQP